MTTTINHGNSLDLFGLATHTQSNLPQETAICKNKNGDPYGSCLELLEQRQSNLWKAFINYQQDNWTDLLPFDEVAYNNAVHSSMGYTPFQVATGQSFNLIPELPSVDPEIPSLKEWISTI